MSSTSMLHMLSPPMPGPVMPVAMQLYMAHSPPLRSLLSSYEDLRARSLLSATRLLPKSARRVPLRPCLSARPHLEDASPCTGWHAPSAATTGRAKEKRVVFADARGLSLTAVRLYSAHDEESKRPQLQFRLSELNDIAATLRPIGLPDAPRLVLDFLQPASDYLGFRGRLLSNSVCLENCTLQERSLTGTVKVRNLAFVKCVSLRLTTDGWWSYRDVECVYMNDVYGCQETDTFSFATELPVAAASPGGVEFCVCYRTGKQAFWDNNEGRNYRLVPTASVATAWNQRGEGWKPPTVGKTEPRECGGGRRPKLEFDQFGSPRTSSGLFPEWQSWGRVEAGTPYW